MEWYTSVFPVWQMSVSLARSFSSLVLRTTSSKAKVHWCPWLQLADLLCFRGMHLWWHWWKRTFPDHLCLLLTWSSTDFHFSRKSWTLPSHVAADHQRWLDMDCICGDNSSQPFLLSLICQFFDSPLGQMPYILLMINVWVVLGHTAADGHVAVCCNLTDVDVLPLQHFNSDNESDW